MIPEKVRDISSISDIDLESPDSFKDTKTLYGGTVTKNTQAKLLNEGAVTAQDRTGQDFSNAANYYLKSLLG